MGKKFQIKQSHFIFTLLEIVIMSLDITNESILIEKSHRWQKVCIDIDVWNQEKKVDKNRFNNWTEIKFTETNLSLMEKMRGKEGIYP